MKVVMQERANKIKTETDLKAKYEDFYCLTSIKPTANSRTILKTKLHQK
jgi:hypothetical protein